MKPNFPGKSSLKLVLLPFMVLGMFMLFSGFTIGEIDEPGKEKEPVSETGKLATKSLIKQMAGCGGCNPVMAAVRDKDVRRILASAYTPGHTIKPVIDFQVGCFAKGCFTRINFVKSIPCDFPPCSAAPDLVVATVEIGCDCTVEGIKSY